MLGASRFRCFAWAKWIGAETMKHTDGLILFEHLGKGSLTFTDFLDKFRRLPKAEQDRLLATASKPGNAKKASA